jgi:hypothetical protein
MAEQQEEGTRGKESALGAASSACDTAQHGPCCKESGVECKSIHPLILCFDLTSLYSALLQVRLSSSNLTSPCCHLNARIKLETG